MTVREQRLHKERLELALAYAQRSTIKAFKTGAVIFDASGEVSSGWSHYSELTLRQFRSIHAELHAILRADRRRLQNSTVYVATIRRKSGTTGMARPCSLCTDVLHNVGIDRAFFTVEGKTWGQLFIEPEREAA